MNESVLLLSLSDFGVIGLLPRIFFRKDGRLVPMWWATSLPFFGCPAVMLAGYAGYVVALVPSGWNRVLDPVSVLFSAASIALIFMTIGTHRIPLALWHQDNDEPRHVVTYGAYSRIRHPFYAAFLLAFLGAFTLFPHWATLLFAGYGLVMLSVTAAREEQRLAASKFGGQYRQYLSRTGRFLPRLRTGAGRP